MKVKSQPSVTPLISRGRKYQLQNDVLYEFGSAEKILIRKGLIFDGASVPRFLHWFIGPMDPRVVASSLLHDALYMDPCLEKVGTYVVNGHRHERHFTKREADDLFREVNEASNLDSFRVNLSYWAVRWFGRGEF